MGSGGNAADIVPVDVSAEESGGAGGDTGYYELRRSVGGAAVIVTVGGGEAPRRPFHCWRSIGEDRCGKAVMVCEER